MRLFLVLSVIFCLNFVAGRDMIITAIAFCSKGNFWCFKQKIVELDLVVADDKLGSDMVCTNDKMIRSSILALEVGDGPFDNELELASLVYHNCTDDRSVLVTPKRLTDFYEQKSESDQNVVEVNGPPIEINYNIRDLAAIEGKYQISATSFDDENIHVGNVHAILLNFPDVIDIRDRPLGLV